MNTNIQATKELILRMRQLTPRQWMKARAVLDMSREEIMEDEICLSLVGAWHKDGADPSKFESYLDKTEEELQTILGFDVDAVRAQLEEALAAATADGQ